MVQGHRNSIAMSEAQILEFPQSIALQLVPSRYFHGVEFSLYPFIFPQVLLIY